VPELLDTIRREINARVEELRPLAREASDPTARARRIERDALGAYGRWSWSGSPVRSASIAAEFPLRARDFGALVIECVAANPGSTAGDVAKALGLNRKSVATRLTQLGKRGDLVKARRGYSAA
jgi:hypothetical protein